MHDFLINVQSVDMPQFLCDSHLQRMIYGLGIDEKLSKMTRAQANALADHLNAGYNKPAYKPTAKIKKKTTAPKKATAKKPAAKKGK